MPRSSFPCAKQSLVPHKAACLTCGCHGALKYQPRGLTSRIVPGWPVQEQTDCPAVSSFPRKALIREPERPSALEEELPESDGTKTGNTTSSSTRRLEKGHRDMSFWRSPSFCRKGPPKISPRLRDSLAFCPTTPLSARPLPLEAVDLKRGEGRSPRSTAVLLVRGVYSPYLRPWTSPAQCSACSSSLREQAQHLATSFFTGTGARAGIRQADASTQTCWGGCCR